MKLEGALLVVFLALQRRLQVLVNCKIITTELCGPDVLFELQATGAASSVTVLLNPKDHKRVCRLNITAPASHVVNLQWREEHRELLDSHSLRASPCPFSVYLPENAQTAVWKGDPCAKNGLSEIDLLTPELRLSWTPPLFGFHTRGRQLIITAVGQGDVCKEEEQHVCLRIGFNPALCVSKQLICDGNRNCPRGASVSDEDEELCKDKQLLYTSWQHLADEVLNELPAEIINNKWIQNKRKEMAVLVENTTSPRYINWKKHEATSPSPDYRHHHDSEDSVSAALAHYGPWGYLMLGMLICGTVLMFCGLWECCFRKPKAQVDVQSQQQPTTVLIINRQQEEVPHQPPNYDDLDQPPSYITLFPHFKQSSAEDSTAPNHDEMPASNASSNEGESRSEEVRERRLPVVCLVTSV